MSFPEHNGTEEQPHKPAWYKLLLNKNRQAVLTTITYWLLAQPSTYQRLMQDLNGVNISELRWTELEQRAYMWAVVHESLRMM